MESPKPQPVSYATLPYFGINAFKFTNAKGTVTFGRYQLRPVAGEHFLTQEQLATMEPDYLSTEIRERVRRGPAKFTLLLYKWQRKTTRSTIPPLHGRTVETFYVSSVPYPKSGK